MSKETNKEKNHILWGQVRQQTDPIIAIKFAADVGEEAINSSIEDRIRLDSKIDSELSKLGATITNSFDKLEKKVDIINAKLFGNGDPSHSMLARLEDLEATVCSLKSTLKWVGAVAGGWIILQLVQIIIKALAG